MRRRYFSLICLVAMVLGAIGVAMAMHAHLEQRMDMLAILKAVGARSSDLLRIFLLQTMALGLLGALIGVVGGAAVMEALPAVFGKLLPVHAVLHFPWRAVLGAGMAAGLLSDAAVLPAAAAGRANHQADSCAAQAGRAGSSTAREWLARWWSRRLCNLGLLWWWWPRWGGIAWALSDSVRVGGWFALLFTIALRLVLHPAGAVALRTLRFFLNRDAGYAAAVPRCRHGLANLYRPGNQSCRRCLLLSVHRRDVLIPRRVSDAKLVAAQKFARRPRRNCPKRVPYRHYARRSGRCKGILPASARGYAAGRPFADCAGPFCQFERQASRSVERPALPAPHARKCRRLGWSSAPPEGRQGNPR